jgi:hypothetical protein
MKAKLLFKTGTSWLPTSLPVFYYGLPDNRVYVIWIRPDSKQTRFEILVEVLEDWKFNYDNDYLIDLSGGAGNEVILSNENVDRYNQRLTTVKVYKGFDNRPSKNVITSMVEKAVEEHVEKLRNRELKKQQNREKRLKAKELAEDPMIRKKQFKRR